MMINIYANIRTIYVKPRVSTCNLPGYVYLHLLPDLNQNPSPTFLSHEVEITPINPGRRLKDAPAKKS